MLKAGEVESVGKEAAAVEESANGHTASKLSVTSSTLDAPWNSEP